MPQQRAKPSFDNGYAPRDGAALYESLQQGAVGNWHAGLGRTGPRSVDVSGYGLNGAHIDVEWSHDGRFGDVWQFNGTTSQVRMPVVPRMQILGNISVSAWVKFASLGANQSIAGCGANTILPDDDEQENLTWLCRLNSSNVLSFFWEMGGGANVEAVSDAASGISIGTWHHLSFVRSVDGTAVAFFVDGQQNGSTITGLSRATGGEVGFVTHGSIFENITDELNGQIASIVVHSRAITLSEIKLLASESDATVALAPRQLAVRPPFIPYPYPVLPSMSGGMLT